MSTEKIRFAKKLHQDQKGKFQICVPKIISEMYELKDGMFVNVQLDIVKGKGKKVTKPPLPSQPPPQKSFLASLLNPR